MRLLPLLLALPLFALPALADSPPKADGAASPRTRLTWEQRFAQANTSHDGHLTLEQAKAGYQAVARHFPEIDTDGKGYVTLDDIRGWHKAQRAARHQTRAAAEDGLRPRPAFQRVFPDQRQFNASAVPAAPTDGVEKAEPATTMAGPSPAGG
jgi:hypothetical protein